MSIREATPRTPRRWLNFNSGAIFLTSGVIAGLLNYFFQVFAKRHLPDAEFSQFTGWLADVSVFFAAANVLQYAANFRPVSAARLRGALLALNVAALVLAAVWIWRPGELSPLQAVLLVASTCALGWLTGQTQIRLAFGILSLSTTVMAAAKLLALLPHWPVHTEVSRFPLALFLGNFPALWIFTVYLWNSKPPESRPNASAAWIPSILIAVSAAVLPMWDLALLYHSIAAADYVDFANASLFFRAIFFLVGILAQWLLPRQILGKAGRFKLAPVMGVTTGLAAVLALASPMISTHFLKTVQPPGVALVFLSCLHMGLLSLVYLRVQELAARGRIRVAALPLIVIGGEGLLQLLLRLNSMTYLVAAACIQSGLLFYLGHFARSAGSDREARRKAA